MYISIEDGRLAAQGSGQGKTITLAQKENVFYAEEAQGYLEFPTNADGTCNELIIRQGAQTISAKRIHPTWGLLGSATSVGWKGESDIPFVEDSSSAGLWNLSDVALQDGEIKFRFNNDWSLNYGDDGEDGVLDLYGKSIKVKAGRYAITLDLRDDLNPNYTISPDPVPAKGM